jgi:ribose 1,5-bisphosphokinase
VTQPIGPGAFIAVIGASGVGKDTLLDLARVSCSDTVHFVRRVITRPPGPGEEFDSLSAADFEEADERGDFAGSWRAHGLAYGLPVSADDMIRAGRVVIANVSRGVISELEERYERVVVVRIIVSDGVRAQRLRARSRESEDDIAQRLARADPAPHRSADYEIPNDGSIQDSSRELLDIIASTIARRSETP